MSLSNDLWSIEGDLIYRHRVESRVHLHVPKEETFPSLVDSQQAISAIKRGYSKRFRCLNRTHRVAIGSLHEIVGDERQRFEIRYIESKLQKGNIYTKALVPAQFSAERLLIGKQRPSNHSNN